MLSYLDYAKLKGNRTTHNIQGSSEVLYANMFKCPLSLTYKN